MTVRFFRCGRCGHRMRVSGRRCGKCMALKEGRQVLEYWAFGLAALAGVFAFVVVP